MRLSFLSRHSALLAVLATLASCSGDAPIMLPLRCEPLPGAVVTPTSRSPLVLRVHLDDPREGGQVLVRVDPLDEEGAVSFETRPPPGAAAVSLASTLSARFQGCFHEDPVGFLLRTPEAPFDRLWLRVSSDRPVRLTVGTGEDLVLSNELEVRPGESGETAWRSVRP